MNESVYQTREELLEIAKSAIGERIGKYDTRNRLIPGKGKGKIGLVIEEGLFHRKADSSQEPDFENLGIELKVTGYQWKNNDKKVSAKERLVITMLDYFNDTSKEFRNSNVYHKIAQMLLMLYEHELDKNEADFILTNYFMYEFENISELDKNIIIRDYDNIIKKILDNQAHEISEGDTLYLGACTKGENSSSTVLVNGIEVMRRAFALKQSYMTYLMRSSIFKNWGNKESFIKDLNLLKKNTLEELVYKSFEPFISKTLTEIDSMFNTQVDRNPKQYLKSYVSRMLNVKDKNLENIDEFLKANIQIKTIRLSRTGEIKESMSFPNFDFIQLSEESWEESITRDMFEVSKFLFVVFDEVNDLKKEYKLRKVMLWNMPTSILDGEVRKVWESTKQILNSEIRVSVMNKRFLNNFPSSKDNPVAHVRPHGVNSLDVYELPSTCKIRVMSNDGTKDIEDFINRHVFTKQSFWLNNKYVLSVINNFK